MGIFGDLIKYGGGKLVDWAGLKKGGRVKKMKVGKKKVGKKKAGKRK